MNRRLRQLYFDVPMIVFCLIAVWALWRYDDAVDAILFSVFFGLIIFICAYRVFKTLSGEDMSTEATLEDILNDSKRDDGTEN